MRTRNPARAAAPGAAFILVALTAALGTAAHGAEAVLALRMTDPQTTGVVVGTMRIVETPYGQVFHPALKHLPPGLHGFHLHENASCEAGLKDGVFVPALAAGGHWDPLGAGHHGEPWGDGHLGDLPALQVGDDGSASQPVLAPRLKQLADVRLHALMVHAGGDSHADHPSPLGGGGPRVACGVIDGSVAQQTRAGDGDALRTEPPMAR